jgi:uncharacterized protein YdeI (YjbR/CyaY-like superfamily)
VSDESGRNALRSAPLRLAVVMVSALNPDVDAVLRRERKWVDEVERLRPIILDSELTEELKWGKPCYTFEKSNVAMLYRMKDYCALGFFKGALLKDANGVLVAPGKNSQAMRWLRFTDVGEVAELESTVRAYIAEAVEVEKTGLRVNFKKTTDFTIPEEFQAKLDGDPELKAAFDALTPGRQRGYILHFSGAKQSKTRASRVEKCLRQILDGKGLNDQH